MQTFRIPNLCPAALTGPLRDLVFVDMLDLFAQFGHDLLAEAGAGL